MAVITYDARRSGCYLGESAAPNIINEEIIIASGAGVLLPGTVLGKITASGKYVLHDAGLSNGAQAAAAILFHKVDATSADVKTVATKNGPATINGNDLIFKDAISDANKLAAIVALRALGLKVLPQHAS
jgi:hypothetical protein